MLLLRQKKTSICSLKITDRSRARQEGARAPVVAETCGGSDACQSPSSALAASRGWVGSAAGGATAAGTARPVNVDPFARGPGAVCTDRGSGDAQSSLSRAGGMLPPLPTYIGQWDRLRPTRLVPI